MNIRKNSDAGLPDWLELLDSDPMSALEQVRDAVLEAESINDDTRQEAIGFIVECIRKAAEDTRYFATLHRSSVFSGDDLGPRKLPVLVARFILDVRETTGRRYEKARSYGQLAEYFAETDFDAQRVASYLRQNGIRRSLEHFRNVEQEAATGDGQVEEQAEHDDYDLLRATGDARSDAGHQQGRSSNSPRGEIVKRALLKEPPPKIARPKLNLETMLVSEVQDDDLRQILATPEGETVTVTMRRHPSKDGQDWKRFVIEGDID
jgi:hypothetical protein